MSCSPLRPGRAAGLLLLLLLLLALPAGASQVAGLPAEKLKKAEVLVTDEIMRQGIPGLSIAVVTGNQIKWSTAYGFADIENHVPAKVGTMYRLGSISKPITAIGVMQLVEQGKIALDAPIQRYVPSYPAKKWPVTVHDLMCHISGVRHYKPGEMQSTRHYDGVVPALEMFAGDPLVFQPGSRFLYTTFGYCLLGAAVEHASKTPYFDYIERHVLGPAGMHRTRLDSVSEIVSDRAAGYVKAPDGEIRNSPLADTSNKVPGGGLCGTVEDLARLAIAVNEGTILPRDASTRMFAAQHLKDGRPIGFGLGWAMFGEHKGKKAVGHSGGQPRISTLLFMVPQDEFAVAIMCNLEGVNLIPLARALADELDP